MKNGKVIKSAGEHSLSEEMALINAYARRELSPEDVYVFSVALCDNDIDRDYERFTVESLFELEKLFVGKTGIIDHDPSAKNQKARIISCKVESAEGVKTAIGDDLFRLTARAYIRRTEGNAELIEAIESGIVKEVSVGCSIGRTVCSVCGNDIHSPLCGHIKGRVYDGEQCYCELLEPKDAYEFSFVAVPAQRAAGVIKSKKKEKRMTDISKLLSCESLTLEGEELKALREYIEGLKTESEYVNAYREELTGRLTESFARKGIRLSGDVAYSVTSKLSVTELRALIEAAGETERKAAAPQLCAADAQNDTGNTEFKI